MIRLIAILLFVVTTFCQSSSVQAESWAFRRSYFSHELPPEVAARYPQPISRSAYRDPVKNRYPGIYVRGGFRQNYIFQRSGNSFDRTFINESYVDFLP